jgi:hypothetical protein
MSTPRPTGTNGSPRTGTFGKPASEKELTHERIAADLAAFSKAGGQVEVLGVTPLRRKPDNQAAATEGVADKKSAPTRPRSG